MVRQLLLGLLLLVTVTGCSTHRAEHDANPPFAPHHVRHFDAEFAWQVERSDGTARLAGSVTNRRYAFMRDLETTVRVLDDKGNLLARETVTDFPTYLPPGRTEPFHILFRLPPDVAPARLSFTYVYWLTEEPPAFKGYDDVPHFGHFEAPP